MADPHAGDSLEDDLMRWPWRKAPEKRSGYTDGLVTAFETRANSISNAAATAAVEAAARAVSHALMACDVEGPDWTKRAISPSWLAITGRSLVRRGEALSVIRMRGADLRLTPAGYWSWEPMQTHDDEDEEDWRVRASTYGPNSTTTRLLTRDQVIYVAWGAGADLRHIGRPPTSWASLTARTTGETERSLGDEGASPVAQIIPLPEGSGDVSSDDDSDPWAHIRSAISGAKGGVLMPETTRGGHGDGDINAPRRDWESRPVHGQPTEAMVLAAKESFNRMLSAAGIPAQMHDASSPSTGMREAARQFYILTLRPITVLLEHELSMRLETEIRLQHDEAAFMDVAGRAGAVKKLVDAGVDPAVAYTAMMGDPA